MIDGIHCPACGTTISSTVVEIEQVPVYCNVLWPDRESALGARRGDIHLGFCGQCGLIHNTAFDPTLVEYSVEYENSLHFSPRFQQYAHELAERLVERFDLRSKRVLEIGCGKGDFLSLLCDLGDNTGLGFDASFDPDAVAQSARFRVVRDRFTDAYDAEAAHLVYCRHVLEHIDSPLPFVERVRRVAGNQADSHVFFEVPNALYTIDDLGIWDIIYEHCLYFSPTSLSSLLRRCGLEASALYAKFHNQFLCIEARVEADGMATTPVSAEPNVSELAARVQRFSEHYETKLAHWTDALDGWAAEGRATAVWGAGSKGVTFLNAAGAASVAAVVDINPRKQGRFVAGVGLEVVSPDDLASARVDTVLVMNPIYRQEIQGMLAERNLAAEVQVV